MLDDAFANLERQVQAGERWIALFEFFNDTQSVKVVVEGEAMLAHLRVKRLLTGMSDRRVADVVHEGERFDEIAVDPELERNGARHLGDFDRVCQAVAV